MSNLDTSSLLKEMLKAAEAVAGDKWPKLRSYAEMESKKLLETAAEVAKMRATGQINDEQARLLMGMQADTARAVLLTTEIMGLAAAEQAINAAMGAVRDTVNKAVGFILL